MADKKFDGFTHKPSLVGTDYLVGYIPTDNIRFQVNDLETYFNGIYTLSHVLSNDNKTGGFDITSDDGNSVLSVLDGYSSLSAGTTDPSTLYITNYRAQLGNSIGMISVSNIPILSANYIQISTSQNTIKHDTKNLFDAPLNEIDGNFLINSALGNVCYVNDSMIGWEFNNGQPGEVSSNNSRTRVMHDTLVEILAPTISLSGTDLKYNGLNIATENYVDNLVAGLKFKKDVIVASPTNINISAAPSTIDGVTPPTGGRVLLFNQTTQTQNGCYNFNGFGHPLTRSSDSNAADELISATYPVRQGTYQDTWYTVTNDTITIGTTNITFSQVAGSGTYTVGSYLKLTGNVFDIDFTTFSTTQISEGTNLYFTDTRAQNAVVASSITDGDTTHSPSGDVVFDALALKLSASNNLSDIANALTARNNLKQWDLFLTAGNQNTTSNVASNITGLVTPTLTANKRYKVSGKILITCNSMGGVKFQVTTPSGTTLSVGFSGNTSSNTAFLSTGVAVSATLMPTALCTNASFGTYVDVTGEISIGATAGTIQFGFASGTNTQTSTVYQLGTHLTVTQID